MYVEFCLAILFWHRFKWGHWCKPCFWQAFKDHPSWIQVWPHVSQWRFRSKCPPRVGSAGTGEHENTRCPTKRHGKNRSALAWLWSKEGPGEIWSLPAEEATFSHVYWGPRSFAFSLSARRSGWQWPTGKDAEEPCIQRPFRTCWCQQHGWFDHASAGHGAQGGPEACLVSDVLVPWGCLDLCGTSLPSYLGFELPGAIWIGPEGSRFPAQTCDGLWSWASTRPDRGARDLAWDHGICHCHRALRPYDAAREVSHHWPGNARDSLATLFVWLSRGASGFDHRELCSDGGEGPSLPRCFGEATMVQASPWGGLGFDWAGYSHRLPLHAQHPRVIDFSRWPGQLSFCCALPSWRHVSTCAHRQRLVPLFAKGKANPSPGLLQRIHPSIYGRGEVQFPLHSSFPWAQVQI